MSTKYRRDRRRKKNPLPSESYNRPARVPASSLQSRPAGTGYSVQTNHSDVDDDDDDENKIKKKLEVPPSSHSLKEAILAARESAKTARNFAQYGTAASPPKPLTSPVRSGQPLIVVSPPKIHLKHEEEEMSSSSSTSFQQLPPYTPPPARHNTKRNVVQAKRIVRFASDNSSQKNKSLRSSTSSSAAAASASASTTNSQSQQIADLLAKAAALRTDSQDLLQQRQERKEAVRVRTFLFLSLKILQTLFLFFFLIFFFFFFCQLVTESQSFQPPRPNGTRPSMSSSLTLLQNGPPLQNSAMEALLPPYPDNSSSSSSNSSSSSMLIAAPPQSPVAPSTATTKENAFRNVQTAANKGHDGAQFQMGVIFEKGLMKQSKDLKEAVRWYSMSAAQDNSRALVRNFSFFWTILFLNLKDL